jgi:hypothetical protein
VKDKVLILQLIKYNLLFHLVLAIPLPLRSHYTRMVKSYVATEFFVSNQVPRNPSNLYSVGEG